MYCRENAYSWRERVIRPIFIWKMRKSLKKSIRQKRSSNLQKRALAPYSRVVLKLKIVKLCLDCYWFLFWKSTFRIRRSQIAQSSLSSKYLRKCKYAYSILQNQYLWIYEDSFLAKILRAWTSTLRLNRRTCLVPYKLNLHLFFHKVKYG